MPDPIVLPHPIRSEQERENLIAAWVDARHWTYHAPAGWERSEWRDAGRGDAKSAVKAHSLLPPVEPLPELLEVWAIVGGGQIEMGPLSDRSFLRKPLAGESLVRLAVVEVLDPEPEPPKAAPSGRRYRLWDNGNGICATLPDGTLVVDCGCKVGAIPLEDVEHVAALLREAEKP